MRIMRGFSSYALAALMAGVAKLPFNIDFMKLVAVPRDYRNRGAKKRRKTGYVYPFSSDRQHARYARQIAAGQLNMEGARNG